MCYVKKVVKGLGNVSTAIGSSIAISNMFKEGGVKPETLKAGKVTYVAGVVLQLGALLIPDTPDEIHISNEEAEEIANEVAKEVAKDFQSDDEE